MADNGGGAPVKNKGVGATLKVNTSSAVTNLNKLTEALTNAKEALKGIEGKEINLNINTKVFERLVQSSKTASEQINKTFVETSKKVQSSLSQNMISTPTSPDFLKRLRENLRQAQDMTAKATAAMQASLSRSFMVDGQVNKGVVSAFGRTSLDNILNNIGGTGLNLSEHLLANRLEAMDAAAKAVDVGRIAQVGKAIENVNLTFDAIDTAKIAQAGNAITAVGEAFDAVDTSHIAAIGNAFETLDAVDTAKLVQTANALKDMDEASEALDLAEMVRNLSVIERTNSFIKMADQAEAARKQVVELGKSIQNVGKFMQTVGNSMVKLGQGIQNYSNYMIKGFMALQYTLRGVIDAAVGGTSDLISSSIEQIKNLEQATIGFQNYFGKREAGFDSEVFLDRIKAEAIRAQGVNAGDLASYISQVAPVAQSSDQAFDVTLGLLKAITYSGGDPQTEMNNVVRNIRDVLAKGQAYAMDINQFNRAIPGLTGILQEMGLTDFIKNDQLSITKQNVGQVMAAFAKFNDPSSPVYDILERMSETLGGAQEMFRETIIQSVSSSIEQSGLLDIWKSMLRNTELQTAIQNGIDTVIRTVARFLEDVGIEHLIEEGMNLVGMLGQYFGDTIVPALKELFGLDEGASMRDVVDNVIKLIGEFGKGLINGLKFLIQAGNWIKDNILPWVQKIGQALGISGDSLAEWAGFLITAAPLLSPLLKVVGSLTSAFGKLLVSVTKFAVKNLVNGEAEGITSSGKLVQLLGGSKLSSVFSKLFSTAGMRGLGIVGTGHMLSGVVGALFGGADSALGKVAQEGTNLASTFIGLATAFNPLVGGIAAAAEGLYALSKAQNEYAEQLHQEKVDAMKDSFDKLEKFYFNSAIESLRAAGKFHEGEEASQQAYEDLIKFINESNYDSTVAPEQIMNDFISTYMKTYGKWKAGDNLIDAVNDWLDPNSDEYITGYTKLSKENAATYAQQIRAAYERMYELGFIGMYDAKMENVDPYDLWKYLYKNSQQFGSVEFLQKFYENLSNPDWIKENIQSEPVAIKFAAQGHNELFDDFGKAAEAAGFYRVELGDGRVAWQDEGTFKIFVELDQAREAFQEFKEMQEDITKPAEGITSPMSLQESLDRYGLVPATSDPGTRSEIYDKLVHPNSTLSVQELIAQLVFGIKLTKSAGGYIRPVYKSSGGFEQGVDTVPAMLAPGEFVQRSSAVSLAGLSVMQALNHGDLGSAYRLLGAKVSHNINNNNSRTVSNTDSHNFTQNFIQQHFHNRSGGLGGMRKIGALMSAR